MVVKMFSARRAVRGNSETSFQYKLCCGCCTPLSLQFLLPFRHTVAGYNVSGIGAGLARRIFRGRRSYSSVWTSAKFGAGLTIPRGCSACFFLVFIRSAGGRPVVRRAKNVCFPCMVRTTRPSVFAIFLQEPLGEWIFWYIFALAKRRCGRVVLEAFRRIFLNSSVG